MKKEITLKIDNDAWMEVTNIANGLFAPLTGFMDSADYKCVVNEMHLADGQPWTLPVTLDLPESTVSETIKAEKLILKSGDNKIAELLVEDVYRINEGKDIQHIFGTTDQTHPGIAKELSRSKYRVGGTLQNIVCNQKKFSKYAYTPAETKKIFQERGWKKIAGFQTRNPLHRAHEYLQRIAMEIMDGIFIHPLIGWKKADDFSPNAIIKAYEKQIELFYPADRVLLCALHTPMRYAGPREAVFHAIIRKNYGCTHFIVGRDHAGVGNYYGKYDAQKLSQQFENLGIEILALCGPYYCRKCGTVVTEKTCRHGEDSAISISGTQVRSLLSKQQYPPEEYMRKEISELLIRLEKEKKLFCGENGS